MPELPEVQNFVNYIHSHYRGQSIEKIVFHRKDLRIPFDIKKLSKISAYQGSLPRIIIILTT